MEGIGGSSRLQPASTFCIIEKVPNGVISGLARLFSLEQGSAELLPNFLPNLLKPA
jgi:hypothetical protein